MVCLERARDDHNLTRVRVWPASQDRRMDDAALVNYKRSGTQRGRRTLGMFRLQTEVANK